MPGSIYSSLQTSIHRYSRSVTHSNTPPWWASIYPHNHLFLWIKIARDFQVHLHKIIFFRFKFIIKNMSFKSLSIYLPALTSILSKHHPSFIHRPTHNSSFINSLYLSIPPSINPSTIPTPCPSIYLHGNSVFDQHRSQLSIQFKEDLSLTSFVQVTQCQCLDVEDLPSLQLHLG